SGGVVLVTEGRRPIKLVHTLRGRLDPTEQAWPVALPDIARHHGSRWVVELQSGALQSLFDRFGDELHADDDYLKQVLSLLTLFRQYEVEGRIRVWPQSLLHWPVPSHRTASRALDAICPVGQTVVVGVFRRGRLYTALAMRRGPSGFDHIVGPSVLRREMGLVSGDWTRDYRYLLRATQDRVGPVCVGCFAELATLQGLAGSRRPGAWAEAIAMREVILSPVVPALAIPLGVDVGLAALKGVRALAERAKSLDWLAREGPLGGLLERMQAAKPPSTNLKSMLGFDPLGLLYKLVEKPRE
ncbi:MAG TPA: hypothetical protein VFU02_14630, partial [Polyangiaceae bacterium]|nr:hypothetical protein [Polyangiaceae bacterium]